LIVKVFGNNFFMWPIPSGSEHDGFHFPPDEGLSSPPPSSLHPANKQRLQRSKRLQGSRQRTKRRRNGKEDEEAVKRMKRGRILRLEEKEVISARTTTTTKKRTTQCEAC